MCNAVSILVSMQSLRGRRCARRISVVLGRRLLMIRPSVDRLPKLIATSASFTRLTTICAAGQIGVLRIRRCRFGPSKVVSLV